MATIPFGGGSANVVRVSAGEGEIRTVAARVDIFGSRLAVFSNGQLRGKIGVPYWENQLVHEALQAIVEKRRGFRYDTKLLIYQVYPDLYAALRRTLHILYRNYGRTFRSEGEKSDLQAALAMLQRVNECFLTLRKSNVDQYYLRLQYQLEQIVAAIGPRPRAVVKQEALNLIRLTQEIHDARGRINPSAKLAQVVAIRNRLEDRVGEILRIEPRVAAQRKTLLAVIDLCELRFRLAADFLERLAPHLEERYFTSHGGEELAKRVSSRLGHLAGGISEIDLRPFLVPGQRTSGELVRSGDLIAAGDYQAAARLLSRSRESLKLRVVRSDMERFITFLSRLIFCESPELKGTEIERAKRGFRNLRARLGTVDESGFRQPVCKHALSLITDAEAEITHRRAGKRVLLEPVKEKLVAVAQLL